MKSYQAGLIGYNIPRRDNMTSQRIENTRAIYLIAQTRWHHPIQHMPRYWLPLKQHTSLSMEISFELTLSELYVLLTCSLFLVFIYISVWTKILSEWRAKVCHLDFLNENRVKVVCSLKYLKNNSGQFYR